MRKILTLLSILITYSLSGQDHHMHDQMNMPKDHSMQNMPMQDHKQMMQQNQMEQERKNDQNHREDAKSKDKSNKGILRYPSVITPNVGSLPWKMDGDVKVFHLMCSRFLGQLLGL
jgi:outer membrane lipopolysaccharide assembly protein LptE/RlpB